MSYVRIDFDAEVVEAVAIDHFCIPQQYSVYQYSVYQFLRQKAATNVTFCDFFVILLSENRSADFKTPSIRAIYTSQFSIQKHIQLPYYVPGSPLTLK